jgi:pimeloyl-ACP methyl ester carboxylesterase
MKPNPYQQPMQPWPALEPYARSIRLSQSGLTAAYRSLEAFYGRLDQLPEVDRSFLFRRVNERVWSDGQRRAFLSTLRHLVRWVPGQQHDLASRLVSLQIPTLGVWGEADRVNSPENGRALVELQPMARLVVVPGAGHNVQQEKPDAVAQAILGG